MEVCKYLGWYNVRRPEELVRHTKERGWKTDTKETCSDEKKKKEKETVQHYLICTDENERRKKKDINKMLRLKGPS